MHIATDKDCTDGSWAREREREWWREADGSVGGWREEGKERRGEERASLELIQTCHGSVGVGMDLYS